MSWINRIFSYLSTVHFLIATLTIFDIWVVLEGLSQDGLMYKVCTTNILYALPIYSPNIWKYQFNSIRPRS